LYGLNLLRCFWEEALLEDLGLASQVVDQCVVRVTEGQEGVGRAAFADFGKGLDVLGIHCLV
jgi:hypothetical protein